MRTDERFNGSMSGQRVLVTGGSGFIGRSLVHALRRQTAELTRSQQVLQESEERYRLLFERHPNPMWVYDFETLAFLASPRAAFVAGSSLDLRRAS